MLFALIVGISLFEFYELHAEIESQLRTTSISKQKGSTEKTLKRSSGTKRNLDIDID